MAKPRSTGLSRAIATLRSKAGGADSERPPAPFIVGLPRSGTTLLRLMLDAHPALAIPPETHFVPELIRAAKQESATPESLIELLRSARTWDDFGVDSSELCERYRRQGRVRPGDAVRGFFELYAEQHGKRRWGDKTPAYVMAMKRINRVLPEARFIHLIRDGRDVTLSRQDRALSRPPVTKVAQRWRKRILQAREDQAQVRHYLEVRYEDLVTDTEAVLGEVCAFTELEFDPQMLSYHERADERLSEMGGELRGEEGRTRQPEGYRIVNHAPTRNPPDASKLGRWKTEMSEPDRHAFEEIAGELLAELGYEVTGAATASERAAT